MTADYDLIAIVISLGAFAVSGVAVSISYLTYKRYRPAVDISAEHLPPYEAEEKTIFTVLNVGSGDLVDPEIYVTVSWSPESDIRLGWGETRILSPTSKKTIECRLPDPPLGQHKLEVMVTARGISLPKKEFPVTRNA